jgi:transcription elongation factor Elf1
VTRSGGIVGLYPEARYSLCGTTAPLPEALGKVCKLLNVPVVVLICHGHHINHPFWNTRRERKVKPTEATMKLIFTPEELAALSPEEINIRLVKEFQYDDFRWQEENRIPVRDPDRARGLEKILYQCPHCGTEYRMTGEGTVLICSACGKTWEMDEFGVLHALDGETEYPHIPDWYEWERKNVRREVRNGTYTTGILPVTVESLPNAKRFIPIGSGTMTHDMNGFRVSVTDPDGDIRVMEKPVPSLYSCHIEYEYLFKHGDCVDLNTLTDTWYVYPHDVPFSVTKMALATEELYYAYREQIGDPCKEGTA